MFPGRFTPAAGNALKEPHASHVYFVIRQDVRKTDVLLQTIDTTWRAYNNYAAPSTYGVLPLPRHNFNLSDAWQNRRAYKVSYNAPLLTRDTRAVNTLFNAEMPAVRWLERHGYDIQYWTGADAHARGEEINRRARVYVSVGHDEYWSGEQRRHVEAARDAGIVAAEVHLCRNRRQHSVAKLRSPLTFLEWQRSLLEGSMGVVTSKRRANENHGGIQGHGVLSLAWRMYEGQHIKQGFGCRSRKCRNATCRQESQESFKIDPEPKQWTGTFRDSKGFNPEGANPENSLTGTIFTATCRHSSHEL